MTEQYTPPRPPFRLHGQATIKHLNVRKEGPEEEKILAVDVKLEFKKVDRRLCAYFDPALEAFLWRGDTDALIVRNNFLNPVGYANLIEGVTVTIGTHSYSGCQAKKFSIEPKDGGVITLTCSVSLNPNADDVSDLAKLVQDEARVEIEGQLDLFAGEPDLNMDGAGNVVLRMFGNGQDRQLQLDDEPDPLYDKAVEVVREHGSASVSLVQRVLTISYNRAARLVERMESEGKVSAMDSSGQRALLMAAA